MTTTSTQSFTSTTDIDTFGWDLVYLSSLENANTAIETLGSGPDTIAQEMQASVGIGTSQKTFKLNASWKPWKFTWTESNSSSGYVAQCEIGFEDTASATLTEWEDGDENDTTAQEAVNTWSLEGGRTVIQFYLAYYVLRLALFRG
ncbi:MAG: hypothetical protein BECKG1743D_GA0114223_112822 [Candidatus Kentron sp. G]|nr:MAG: hypothetical protein BECKG1743D_GA0114223_112822 [Candidatus Kentron sp. G]